MPRRGVRLRPPRLRSHRNWIQTPNTLMDEHPWFGAERSRLAPFPHHPSWLRIQSWLGIGWGQSGPVVMIPASDQRLFTAVQSSGASKPRWGQRPKVPRHPPAAHCGHREGGRWRRCISKFLPHRSLEFLDRTLAVSPAAHHVGSLVELQSAGNNFAGGGRAFIHQHHHGQVGGGLRLGFKDRFHFFAVTNLHHHATFKKKVAGFHGGRQRATWIAPRSKINPVASGWSSMTDRRSRGGLVEELIDPNHQDPFLEVATATDRPFFEVRAPFGF